MSSHGIAILIKNDEFSIGSGGFLNQGMFLGGQKTAVFGEYRSF